MAGTGAVQGARIADAQRLNDDVIDRALIRRWLAWGFFWLLFFPTLGVVLSTKFTYPEFLGDQAWLTFGRLRPIHVNGVIWGAFSTLFIGLCHYIVPRLCGVRLWNERWSPGLLWVWNLNLAVAVILLAAGFNRGWEAWEFAPGNVIVIILGPYNIPGINNAAWHGLFIHYVVGLWITPAGYVLIYYFLPASVRNPIYSHKLSLIGFWSLAFFYPFVGIHHYLYSPIADWAETIAIVSSMMLIIPVWTVLQNFFGTMIGRWQEFGRNLPAKFLIVGSILYLIGCFQGSMEALRSIQQPTHFTDFVISHSHLTVFGTFVVWAIAGAIYVWPRITGSAIWSFKLGNWGFWLITLGISAMGLVLSAQGLQQGFMLMAQSEFLETVTAMRPYWWVRTVTGIAMDLGISLVVYTLMKGSLARRSA